MTVAEKLAKINEIKQQSLQAIQDKGGDISTATPLANYPEAIRSIPQTVSSALSNVYSTEETVVGTWIDGRPLYRKSAQGTTPSAANSALLLIPLGADVLSVVNLYGTIAIYQGNENHSISNSQFTDTRYQASSNMGRGVITTPKASSATNSPIFVTVEYTKTTDEPGTIELSPAERAVFAAAKAAEHAISVDI